VADALKEVSADGQIQRSIPRDGVWAMQTPQAFPLGLLIRATQKAMVDGVVAPDEAALVERIGQPVWCVEGASDNLKITTASDIRWAERLIEANNA